MKLYRESGVNPLSGCWPVLLQFPILIAMYAVLRPPTYTLPPEGGEPVPVAGNIHIPTDSQLYQNVVIDHTGTDFLFMNLQCSAIQSGTGEVQLKTTDGKPIPGLTIDCGDGIPAKIPYFGFLFLMVGSTFIQQRQMQKAAPPGATNQQQQALFKIMPILFGVFGIGFPSGLVLYWTTSNLWQIGQQYTMLRLGHIGPAAMAAPTKPPKEGGRKGIMARMMETVDKQRSGEPAPPPKGAAKGGSSSKSSKNTNPGSSGGAKGSGSSGSKGSPGSKPGTGGSSAGSRKKRPKR